MFGWLVITGFDILTKEYKAEVRGFRHVDK